MQFSYLTPDRSRHERSDIVSKEEVQPLDTSDSDSSHLSYHYTKRTASGVSHRLLVCILVGTNFLLLLSSTALILARNAVKEEHYIEKNRSSYSPVYDRLHVYRSEVRHNFTNYWPDNNPSIFQQMPSPEVDEAWFRASRQHSIALSADEVRRLGYDPATVWPAPKDEFGEGVYYGVIDVFHQIHCLNALRQTAFPQYYGDMREKNKHSPLKWDDHLLHCSYAVLRSLMCHADLEVIVGQKFTGWPGLNMNFASTKQCRNYEEILEWKEANSIIPHETKWTEFPDQPIIEMDPEGVLTPYGNHLGLEDYALSQGIELDIPPELAWQPKKKPEGL
ncbi:hypothetical protein UA08_06302 [Talaromyces atroroseus]|uniref:Tat pathway signal sequence n=1 Tax=Talaromyces atroroseus TaxID=1441469 RepID=A0A225AN83_TALAT|nr:hypothetical protein UA08_06302 [Talaromyces atroroseus]OKL58748.1 hypothetical protein UA08_06302 [Talaromyces atroroseus]